MTVGIYSITNINNNKKYIGSSNNIEKRWKEHLYNLENNKHHSIKLQRSWNKTKDKNVFKFEIIEILNNNISVNELHNVEQKYIDKYDSFKNGYNCSLVDNPKYSLKNINKNKKLELKNIYYNYFIELYNDYSNNINISKTYTKKLLDKHYDYKIYKQISLLILEYEKYFNINDYYIKLYSNKFQIESNNRNPLITYDYKIKNNDLILSNISKNLKYLSKNDNEYFKFLYK